VGSVNIELQECNNLKNIRKNSTFHAKALRWELVEGDKWPSLKTLSSSLYFSSGCTPTNESFVHLTFPRYCFLPNYLHPILHCTLDDVNTPNTPQECNCSHKQNPVQIWYALKINVFSIVLEVSTGHVGCDCKSAALYVFGLHTNTFSPLKNLSRKLYSIVLFLFFSLGVS
jgi:hypothetical protein